MIKEALITYASFFTKNFLMEKEIKIIITQQDVDEYNALYKETHPRSKKPRINAPQHPSMNVFTRKNFQAANLIKQNWLNFIVWKITKDNLKDKKIKKCTIFYKTYFYRNTRHDLDNISPKYILDGFVEGGLLEDDNSDVITRLTLECEIDKENPRMEFIISVLD